MKGQGIITVIRNHPLRIMIISIKVNGGQIALGTMSFRRANQIRLERWNENES